ncbi:hypothetical protein ElyMa_001225600 [Elysia marginata]|uniref:Glycosyl hydrolase family 13 catalytic domain-containing protein n=1 Tax=Elysia marginata TaxID=1093978 RepID=A0AAV4IAG7_9GAST|nr:hypothetical protein ElyMa_001225600 [Elysia marginata]
MERYKDTLDGSWERQREIAKMGGWELFVSNHDSALARLPGPTGLARASWGEGALVQLDKDSDTDRCNSLMIPPLLPALPNQCKHSVHVHTPTRSIPACTLD